MNCKDEKHITTNGQLCHCGQYIYDQQLGWCSREGDYTGELDVTLTSSSAVQMATDISGAEVWYKSEGGEWTYIGKTELRKAE